MRLSLFLIPAFVMTSLFTSSATEPASPDTMVFCGRWDLRTPGRAITVNSGSYVRVQFKGTAVTALFDTAVNKDPFPTLAWRIDDGAWQEDDLAPRVSLADKLTDGPHSLWLMVRALDEHQNRWTHPLVASVTFLGLDLSDGKLLPPLQAWIHPRLKIEFLGDSITEGVLVGGGKKGATWPWLSNALLSYSARTAIMLGADWRQVGFGATGVTHGGSGGTLAALDSFNFFYDGCPRDAWQPDIVVINQGTNEANNPPEEYQPAYLKYLTLVRQAYPNAQIVALRPFSGRQETNIKQAVETFRAQGDKNVFYIDTTGWYNGGENVHPPFTASLEIASKLSAALKALCPSARD
jgi:lysophospholipase L1-like esterase